MGFDNQHIYRIMDPANLLLSAIVGIGLLQTEKRYGLGAKRYGLGGAPIDVITHVVKVIVNKLWPEVNVEENNLRKRITNLMSTQIANFPGSRVPLFTGDANNHCYELTTIGYNFFYFSEGTNNIVDRFLATALAMAPQRLNREMKWIGFMYGTKVNTDGSRIRTQTKFYK